MRDSTSSAESQRLCSAKPSAIPPMTSKKKSHAKLPLHCLIYPIWVFESPLTWSDMSQPEVSEGFHLFENNISQHLKRENHCINQADKFLNCAWEKGRRKLWLMAPFERGVGHQGSSLEKRSTESGNPCPKRNAPSPALQAAKHPRTRNASCNSSKQVLPSHEHKIQIGSWIIVLFLKKRIPKCPSASLDSSLSHLSSLSWLMEVRKSSLSSRWFQEHATKLSRLAKTSNEKKTGGVHWSNFSFPLMSSLEKALIWSWKPRKRSRKVSIHYFVHWLKSFCSWNSWIFLRRSNSKTSDFLAVKVFRTWGLFWLSWGNPK